MVCRRIHRSRILSRNNSGFSKKGFKFKWWNTVNTNSKCVRPRQISPKKVKAYIHTVSPFLSLLSPRFYYIFIIFNALQVISPQQEQAQKQTQTSMWYPENRSQWSRPSHGLGELFIIILICKFFFVGRLRIYSTFMKASHADKI